jgi:hypothetical protein
MNYPKEAVTLNDKVEFCYQAQEALRLEHNSKGADFRTGVISETTWKDYTDNEFKSKSQMISKSLCTLKDELKASTRFTVDLNNLE